MIVGNVNAKREAVVQLAVFGENQQYQGIKAIIDTGYTGFLTLPSAAITTLGLTWYMGLLEGYELKIQAVAGGSVTITALP